MARFIAFLWLIAALSGCGAIVTVRIEMPNAPTLAATDTQSPSPTASATATMRPSNTPTPSPTAIGLSAVTTANVNLRTIPTTVNNTPIRVVPFGETVFLIGRLDGNNPTWARTSEGWIYTQNLGYPDFLVENVELMYN